MAQPVGGVGAAARGRGRGRGGFGRGFVPRSHALMPALTERMPGSSTIDITQFSSRTFTGTIAVDILTTEDPTFASRLFHTMVFKATQADTDPLDAVGYILSAICAVFPSLLQHAKTALVDQGYTVNELTDNNFGIYTGDWKEWIEVPRIVCMMSQLVILFYKNVNEVSYVNNITNRMKATKALVGLAGNVAGQTDILFSLDRAQALKVKLSAMNEFKGKLLYAIINGASAQGPLKAGCRYLCAILNWTDMAGILFIFNTLVLPDSPVLGDERILPELIHLCKACDIICDFCMPQYFRILNPEMSALLHKSNFRLLSAVTQEILVKTTPSARFFVAAGIPDRQVVDDLVTVHEQVMAERRMIMQTNFQSHILNMRNVQIIPPPPEDD